MSVRAHLQEDLLYECYYAERRGEALDPPSAEHLGDCESCARRYAEVCTFLTDLRDDADAEIAALFPPERLRAQQQEITRRLEFVGRAARVITFPARFVSQHARPAGARLAARWIAAAAAAGLFVGVAAGTIFNFSPRVEPAGTSHRMAANAGTRQLVNPAAHARMSSPDVKPAAVVNDTDDKFMSDLEAVLDRPHTSELTAFDALTPHIREVRDFAR